MNTAAGDSMLPSYDSIYREARSLLDKKSRDGDRPELFSMLDHPAKNRIADRVATLALRLPRTTHEISASEETLAEKLASFALCFVALATTTSQLPPSVGYEPVLQDSGFNPVVARGLAVTAVKSAKRRAREGTQLKNVMEALRFLAQSNRQPERLTKRCGQLHEIIHKSSIVDTMFAEVGLSEAEFVCLVQARAKGCDIDVDRLTAITIELLSRLKPKRGPKISEASAAHGFLLGLDLRLTRPRRPRNHDGPIERYPDPLTEATRLEFGLPDFDSRPAKRRAQREL